MNYNQITVVKTTVGDVSTSVITLDFLNTLVLLSVFFVFLFAFKVIFRRKRL